MRGGGGGGVRYALGVRVSVVVPVFNEPATVGPVLDRLLELGVADEIVVVDDGSTDGTADELRRFDADPRVTLLAHERNRGKGAAIRTAIPHLTGDVAVIQDADLEYDPAEIPRLAAPIAAGRADAVFGSRFVGSDAHRVLYFWHYVGNRLLTLVSNALTNLNLTDMETCYKAVRVGVLRSIRIEEDRFGVEPELTAKIAARRCRVYEVGVSYAGRTYAEGKKITWRDGVRALWCVLKYNLWRRDAGDHAPPGPSPDPSARDA